MFSMQTDMSKEVIPTATAAAEVQCPVCSAGNKLFAGGQSLYKVCDSCHTLFQTQVNDKWFHRNFGEKDIQEQEFIIGNLLKVYGIEYTICGCAKFKNFQDDFWLCYYLFHPEMGWRYLIDSDGHFVFTKDISYFSETGSNIYPEIIWYENRKYDPVDKYTFNCVIAVGEFPSEIKGDFSAADYSRDDQLLSFYGNLNGFYAESGHYLERREISKANHLKLRRSAKGHHYLQPNPWANKAKESAMIVLIFGLLTFLITFYMNSTCLNREILNDYGSYTDTTIFSRDSSNTITDGNVSMPEKVTSTFSITKSISNLEFNFLSDVAQNWVSMEFTLVNENTGEERYLSKDLEYYSGSDGGESWSEGDREIRFTVGNLESGKYHIAYKPLVPVNIGNTSWHLIVYEDVPGYSNWGIVFLISLIFPVYFWIRNNKFLQDNPEYND